MAGIGGAKSGVSILMLASFPGCHNSKVYKLSGSLEFAVFSGCVISVPRLMTPALIVSQGEIVRLRHHEPEWSAVDHVLIG